MTADSIRFLLTYSFVYFITDACWNATLWLIFCICKNIALFSSPNITFVLRNSCFQRCTSLSSIMSYNVEQGILYIQLFLLPAVFLINNCFYSTIIAKDKGNVEINLSIYILIKLWSPWLYVCLFEAVHTNPGYGMAALISNNLLNLISGTVILLRSS